MQKGKRVDSNENNPEYENLKKYFGYKSFRPGQKEIVECINDGKDVLAVMPTGAGKSICYQVPALMQDGLTLVISPLIALMKDQVENLKAKGISSAYVNSSLSSMDLFYTLDNAAKGKYKILYIAPERLDTPNFKDFAKRANISIIAIDESHCVSQWGHDFRPDYLDIASIRLLLPNAVVLGLTATATEQVKNDIARNLKLKNPSIFISSFNRSNIYLEVQPKRKSTSQIIDFIRKHSGDSGIIYCFSRRQVDELTETLDKLGYSVLNYHAGLPDAVRAKNQELFIKDEVQIMVATIAFGMGIDKPNVRFVINLDLPKSLEEYYQEINAPKKGLKIMEECGHMAAQFDDPGGFAEVLKEMLASFEQ